MPGVRPGIISRFFFRIGWLWLAGLLLITPTQARIVGLVLDDSGSMYRIFGRARFATQLLVSVLDSDDKLYVARLNGEGGRVVGPIDLMNRRAYLSQISDAWQAIDGNPTPYAPLEDMLEKLVDVTPADEEASLLVITDGEFDRDSTPSPSELNLRYQQLKNAFKGKNLNTYFVVLKRQEDLLATIEQQGVRRELLTVFNGSPDAGRVDIDKTRNVVSGLREVIAQLYGTDLDNRGNVVTLRGNRIELQPPFSISRMVVVIPEEGKGEPARFKSASFDLQQDPPVFFQPAIQGNRAHVYHLRPLQPLLPDAIHTLVFDRPLPADTQVLFDSGLALELSFFNDQGKQLFPDAQGRLVVSQGVELEVRAVLVDRLNPKAKIVDLGTLRHDPTFTLHQGNRAQRMQLNKPQNYATTRVSYDNPGQYTLTVVARYPGFITRRAQDIIIDVKQVRSIDLSLTPERLDGCTNCAPDESRLTYTTQKAYQNAFAFEVKADNVPEPGDYRLELDQRLPAGVRLLLPDGKTTLGGLLSRSQTLTLEPGKPARLLLQYNNEYRTNDAHTLHFKVKSERTDWQGEAETTLKLVPHTLTLRFKAAGHTGADPNQPFRLALTDLDQGEGVYVAAEGLLRPLQTDWLKVRSQTLNFSYRLDGADRILVIPEKNWWCDCLTPAGDHVFTLSYRDRELNQRASYSGKITLLDVPWWEKCWQELLLLLLILLVLAKIVCLLRTERFPSRSRLVISDLDGVGALRRIPLHSSWSTLLSCRNERRRAEALQLRAAPQGASIIFNRNYPPTLSYEMTGETIQEVFERHHQRDIPWRWGESLRDEELGQRFILVKDISKYRAEDEG